MDHEERAERILAEVRKGYWSDPELIEFIVMELEELEAEVRKEGEGKVGKVKRVRKVRKVKKD